MFEKNVTRSPTTVQCLEILTLKVKLILITSRPWRAMSTKQPSGELSLINDDVIIKPRKRLFSIFKVLYFHLEERDIDTGGHGINEVLTLHRIKDRV